MTIHEVTIAMNGVTGRMGVTQHLIRSILAIRNEGGVPLDGGDSIWPEPILVGRSEKKLRGLAEEHGLEHWSTDLDETLSDPNVHVYFDSQVTSQRATAIDKALRAGKHVYCEKPLTEDTTSAVELATRARSLGVKNGVVQDKLFLPGLRKLQRVIESDFFGRILSIRGEFGYWVFEGLTEPPQRPSWNYRSEDGGGMVLDMFPHWQYILENLFAPIEAVSCITTTHIPERVDETGNVYQATADDSAYAIFELEGGIVAQINSSWATRVYRDDLVVFQVDGTGGSAVVSLRDCLVQHRSNSPRAIWNPDVPNPIDFRLGWLEVPAVEDYGNAFKVQWERFLRHVVLDAPFPWDFARGAKGVQLAEVGSLAAREGRRVEVPELEI